MSTNLKVVHNAWNSFTDRHAFPMTISFDDAVTEGDPPSDLNLCTRIIIPILGATCKLSIEQPRLRK